MLAYLRPLKHAFVEDRSKHRLMLDLPVFGQMQFAVGLSLLKTLDLKFPSIIDPRLGLDPFSVSMLNFINFAHRIRKFDDLRMSVSSS